MGIGDRLKEERLRLGMNQTEFAAITGVTKNSQFNYEKGERSPDAAYLAAASAAGVDVLYVLTGNRVPMAAETLSEKESTMVEKYRSLGQADQASLDRLVDALAETTATHATKKDD
ncbi:helix-turn-helix domain-containing protein [Azorhizophilus paspali]|uniref:Helix-turn-helix domain-containing protein n=1 Tax=Azorhizophilus paspali TaxID=69963 RepID=A0ABV6SH38_AZOPA